MRYLHPLVLMFCINIYNSYYHITIIITINIINYYYCRLKDSESEIKYHLCLQSAGPALSWSFGSEEMRWRLVGCWVLAAWFTVFLSYFPASCVLPSSHNQSAVSHPITLNKGGAVEWSEAGISPPIMMTGQAGWWNMRTDNTWWISQLHDQDIKEWNHRHLLPLGERAGALIDRDWKWRLYI